MNDTFMDSQVSLTIVLELRGEALLQFSQFQLKGLEVETRWRWRLIGGSVLDLSFLPRGLWYSLGEQLEPDLMCQHFVVRRFLAIAQHVKTFIHVRCPSHGINVREV